MEVVIETPRLILRKHEAGDLDFFASLMSDMRVMKWVGGRTFDREHCAQRLEKYIENEHATPYGFWVVALKDSGEQIGQGGVIPIARSGVDPRDYAQRGPEIEVGYRFAVEYWGKGYATEVAKASVAHGFEVIGLDRIIAVTKPDNEPSKRVLEKAGLSYVGETDDFYDTTCALFEIRRDR